MSVYEINLQGSEFNLDQYQQKFLIIVNIADACGFAPQLQALSLLNQDSQIPCQVLAFPSNSFKQQMRDAGEMRLWCEVSQKLSFPIYDIIEVNGINTHPLFKYLKQHARGSVSQQWICWNYTKFVISPKEKSIKRFSPFANINKIRKYIDRCNA